MTSPSPPGRRWRRAFGGQVPAGRDGPDGARLRSGVNAGVGTAFDLAELLAEMAAAKGCTASQLALAWCMAQPGIVSPIVGPRTVAQLDDNLGALHVALDDEDEPSRRDDRALLAGGHAPAGEVGVKQLSAVSFQPSGSDHRLSQADGRRLTAEG